MKLQVTSLLRLILLLMLVFIVACSDSVWSRSVQFEEGAATGLGENLTFVHHSVGFNWLNSGLREGLLAKSYIAEQYDIYYGTVVEPDAGRPNSLGAVPGDNTNLNHWILWFNDYFQALETDAAGDHSRIIMFKSCFFNSNIGQDGTEPGDPFDEEKSLANYKAVYRHPDGSGSTYNHDGYSYKALEDVFAAHPDILFIPITTPPLVYEPAQATSDEWAHRVRLFSNWLKEDWLAAYNAAHPGLNNVAVFDLFDLLAYPDDHDQHPNRLRAEYGGESGDSHPNNAGNAAATAAFTAGPDSFLDLAWQKFIEGN
jgi:hypothetical protein